MKIGYLSNSTIPSQTANSIHVMKMCQAMVQEGHDVILFAYQGRFNDKDNQKDIWDQYAIKKHFPILWLRKSRLGGYDKSLFAVLKAMQNSTDLIYTRNLSAATISSVLGFSTICELHDMPSGHIGSKLLPIFVHGKGYRRLVLISESLRQDIKKVYSSCLKGRDLIVSHDGVDLERFANLMTAIQARHHLGLEQKFTIGYAGSLYSGRGIELILRLAQKLMEARFLIVGGDVGMVGDLKRNAKCSSYSNIIFFGHVPHGEVPLYLSACDVLLMPYQRKVAVSGGGDTAKYMSPMKLFEYMAMERIIISSDLPVLREILNENNSVLCSPDDIQSWLVALRKAISNIRWRNQLAQNARNDAKNYTWQKRVQTCVSGIIA